MAIEKALKEDLALRQEWEALLQTFHLLEFNLQDELQPNEQALENILHYSQDSLTTG